MIALVLIAVSALLYAASFPPLSLGVLAWCALAPFLVASTLVRPVRAAVLGALFGILITHGVAWWFPRMLSDYFGVPLAIAWAGFVTVSFLLVGTYCALFAGWVSWLVRRRGAGPLVIAAGWVACELARARLYVGNPWGLSGYSQTDFRSLMQIADVTGVYGVCFLLAAVNTVLASVFVPGLRGRWPRVSLATVAAALLVSVVYGQWRLSETFANGTPFRVALVQGAVQRGFSWQPEYQHLGLGRYLDLTWRAAKDSPDLVIWPEHAVNFYVQERSAESMILLGKSSGFGSELIFGGPHYAASPGGRIYHNSAFLARAGRIAGRYDKQRLLPIAEAPLFGIFGYRQVDYSPGTGSQLLETRVGKAGVFVCFEALYPELVRRSVHSGAELLVNLSNDAWLGSPTAAARQHLNMAAVRAIENRRYLLRATSTGFSAIVDPHGRVVAESGAGTTDVLRESIHPTRVATLYQWWGDIPAWLAGVIVVAVTSTSGLRRRL